jgi:hypothetical protein
MARINFGQNADVDPRIPGCSPTGQYLNVVAGARE